MAAWSSRVGTMAAAIVPTGSARVKLLPTPGPSPYSRVSGPCPVQREGCHVVGLTPAQRPVARGRLAGHGARRPERRLLFAGQARHGRGGRAGGRRPVRRGPRGSQGRGDPAGPPATEPVLRLE